MHIVLVSGHLDLMFPNQKEGIKGWKATLGNLEHFACLMPQVQQLAFSCGSLLELKSRPSGEQIY